jgi:hypothetical protein
MADDSQLSHRESKPPNKFNECVWGDEIDTILCEKEISDDVNVKEKPLKHLQCDGKTNNVTFKTDRVQVWRDVLVDHFESSQTVVQKLSKKTVIKITCDVENEKNISVKVNFFDTGSVNIQGIKSTLFSDHFFEMLKLKCDNHSENFHQYNTCYWVT